MRTKLLAIGLLLLSLVARGQTYYQYKTDDVRLVDTLGESY